MAAVHSSGVIPDISYDDGVSTIRISSTDRKGHILRDQPGAVHYSSGIPSEGYVNSGYVKSNKRISGEVIGPVLVRDQPDGEEIVQVQPVSDFQDYRPPPIVPQKADLYCPPAPRDVSSSQNARTVARDSNDNVLDDLARPNAVLPENNNAGSILKKTGDKRKALQQRKISWNENVKIREPESKNKVTVTELQKENHEYNPLEEPRQEGYPREAGEENALGAIAEEDNFTDVTDIESSVQEPNGGIDLHREVESNPPSPRHVPPYGAEHFGERETRRKYGDGHSKWCMRVTICVLIFLLTFAIIGVIVLGLLYTWRLVIFTKHLISVWIKILCF